MRNVIVITILVATIGSAIYFFTNRAFSVQEFKDRAEQVSSLVLPTPALPQPFQELTIPYLRSQEFSSTLGELKAYQSRANYTSYLTSYDSDGLQVNGLLTIPFGDEPEEGWPAIVFVHGYIPPTLYETTERYQDYVDYLARNGFVVFKIDLRGHDDSEGTPSGAYYSSGYIIDTLNAYSALQNADFVNADAVGLWGHSMAGNVTFRSFVADQSIPALVIWAGAVYSYEDMSKYGIDDNSYRPPTDNTERERYRSQLRETYGNYDGSSEFWKQVVPTNYLDGVGGAIQIHHAVDDSVVNIGYSRDLMRLLDNTDMPHQLQEYSTGGHNLEGSSFTQAMQSTVEFYKQYLR